MAIKRNSQKLPGVALKRINVDIPSDTVSLEVERTGSLENASLCNVYVSLPVYFYAGETLKTLTLSSDGDAAFAATESFGVFLADAENAQFEYTATQIDTSVPEVVSVNVVSVSGFTVTEGGIAQHTVTLSGTTQIEQAFAFGIVPITASALDYNQTPSFNQGVTYNQSAGLISVPAGVNSFVISLATIEDSTAELAETYTIQVGGVGAIGTINDNDSVTPPQTLNVLTNIAIFEVPYGMLSAQQKAAIAGNGGFLGFAVGSQSGAVAYAVHISTSENGTYTQVLTNQAFAPSADLYGLINFQKSTVAFRNQTDWPKTISPNTVGLITDTAGQQEFCLLQGWSSQTQSGDTATILTLDSGIFHSLPIEVSHDETARVYALSDLVIDTTLRAQNTTLYVKVAPINAQGDQLALSSITAIPITITGVANQPYPPRSVGYATALGSLPEVGEFQKFPTAQLLRGDIYIYLANSNRIGETVPSGFNTPASNREAGTTYQVEVIGRDNQVLRTLTADTNGFALYGFSQRGGDGELDPTEFRVFVDRSGTRSSVLTNIVSIEHRDSPDLNAVSSSLSASTMTVTLTMELSRAWPYALEFSLSGTASDNVTAITASNGVTVQEGRYLFIPANAPTTLTVTITTSGASGETLTFTAGKFGSPGGTLNTSQTF